MATSAAQSSLPAVGGRSAVATSHASPQDATNGQGDPMDSNMSSTTPSASTTKKSKKKAADPNETGKLLAAKINQLELDAAGEKDQEAEIGACLLSHWLSAFIIETSDL